MCSITAIPAVSGRLLRCRLEDTVGLVGQEIHVETGRDRLLWIWKSGGSFRVMGYQDYTIGKIPL